jgi:hypothetical protein
LLEPDKAAWIDDKNIGDKEVSKKIYHTKESFPQIAIFI